MPAAGIGTFLMTPAQAGKPGYMMGIAKRIFKKPSVSLGQ